MQVSHCRAKQLLHANKWNVPDILARTARPSAGKVEGGGATGPQSGAEQFCLVCASSLPAAHFISLPTCGHSYCKLCWETHFETQVGAGVCTGLACMAPGCDTLVEEDLVLSTLQTGASRDRYRHLCFIDYVRWVQSFSLFKQESV